MKRTYKKNGRNVRTRFYIKYLRIKEKCYNTNSGYIYSIYGGRGIGMYKDWLHNYESFRLYLCKIHKEAIEKYGYDVKLSLDRIKNDKDYEPNNLRFTTSKIQSNNTRASKEFIAISPNGIEYHSSNQKDFAKEHSLVQAYISNCLHNKRDSVGGWKFKYVS